MCLYCLVFLLSGWFGDLLFNSVGYDTFFTWLDALRLVVVLFGYACLVVGIVGCLFDV